MNIVFICGSLQAGCDGVGDYTFKLAEELNRAGHMASIIAINDRYIEINNVAHITPGLINQVQVLRIPSTLSIWHRLALAKCWIKQVRPVWVSLQFVPFAFQNKGLPFAFGTFLKKLESGFKWHIMFHELWVGMPVGASKKHVLWGWLQKQLIKALISELQPVVIHTSCQLYYKQLVRLNLEVRHLPLFSNIPVSPSSFCLAIESHQNEFLTCRRAQEVTLIIFGTIHPQALTEKFIEIVTNFKMRHKIQFRLVLIGRCGPNQKSWISACQLAGILVDVHGEQSAETISHLLSTATIGISTSAFPMTDKSGTVAAMLEHQLPVICVGDTWVPRDVDPPKSFDGIYALHDDCIEACLNRQKPNHRRFRASDVAEELIRDLKNINSNGRN